MDSEVLICKDSCLLSFAENLTPLVTYWSSFGIHVTRITWRWWEQGKFLSRCCSWSRTMWGKGSVWIWKEEVSQDASELSLLSLALLNCFFFFSSRMPCYLLTNYNLTKKMQTSSRGTHSNVGIINAYSNLLQLLPVIGSLNKLAGPILCEFV